MVGKKIKARREELGLTQEQLAHRLGFKSKSSINKIEMEKNDISQSKIKLFADALDCDPTYFIDDSINSDQDIKKALELYNQYKNAIPQVQTAVEALLKPPQSDV